MIEWHLFSTIFESLATSGRLQLKAVILGMSASISQVKCAASLYGSRSNLNDKPKSIVPLKAYLLRMLCLNLTG